ncbi:MAG: energy-coupling factor ABC transporter ATP-binding protein [Candidatus Helarchaeota archaeon]
MIQTQDLIFSYDGKRDILKNVSLRIKDGESVAILGENGAGKTTLIKTFNGLLKPQKGEVFIDGISTKATNMTNLARKVGIAFQNPDHALFNETVRDEILFSLKNWNLSRQEIEEKLEETIKLFRLEALLEKSPFNLSGGQRKLVSIASIFCWNPKHLILDEPTIGQDLNHKKLLTKILKEYLDSERIVITVTHDVDWAVEVYDRVLIIKNGMILADGPPGRIFSNSRIVQESSLLLPQSVSFVKACRNIWSDFPHYLIKDDEIHENLLKRLK